MKKLDHIMILKDAYIIFAMLLGTAFLMGASPIMLVPVGAALDRAYALDALEDRLTQGPKQPKQAPSGFG